MWLPISHFCLRFEVHCGDDSHNKQWQDAGCPAVLAKHAVTVSLWAGDDLSKPGPKEDEEKTFQGLLTFSSPKYCTELCSVLCQNCSRLLKTRFVVPMSLLCLAPLANHLLISCKKTDELQACEVPSLHCCKWICIWAVTNKGDYSSSASQHGWLPNVWLSQVKFAFLLCTIACFLAK